MLGNISTWGKEKNGLRKPSHLARKAANLFGKMLNSFEIYL